MYDLTKAMGDNAFKIAVYHPNGSEKNIYPYLKHFEKDDLEVVISGKYWVDIMNKNINKGKALEIIQKKLNILPSQTLAFGDYMNDIEMLRNSKFSYAMENAHPSVKEVAMYETVSNDDFGVLSIVESLFNT